jgi:hypothetical protein
MRTVRSFTLALTPGWLLELHSDGVSSRVDLDGALTASTDDLQALADSLLARWARASDDATLVLVTASR